MKITLPKSLEAEIHEQTEGRLDAMGIEPGHKSYKKAYGQIFHEICTEIYYHSMTPAGSLKPNPTSPKVPKSVMDSFYLTQVAGFLKDLGADLSGEQRKFLRGQIIGATSSLTNVLLRIKYGFQVKRKGDEQSDFYYRPMRGKSEAETDDMIYQVTLNRYFRYMVIAMLTAHIEKFFKSPNTSRNALLGLMQELLPKGASRKEMLKVLKSKQFQKQFTGYFYEKVLSGEIKI